MSNQQCQSTEGISAMHKKPVLLSSRKVLVVKDPQRPIYKTLSLDHEVTEKCQGLHILQTVHYEKFINLVTSYLLTSDIIYWYM